MTAHHKRPHITLYNLYGLFILAIFVHSALALPAAGKKEATDEGKSGKNEYDEYSEDEEMPGEQKQFPQSGSTTPRPYFNEKIHQVFVKLHENATLECPVKNFNNESHALIWFKNNSAINNGGSMLLKGYSLDDNYSLVIDNITMNEIDNYYCTILPQEVRRQVIVTIGEQPTTTSTMKSATNSKTSANIKEEHKGNSQCRPSGHSYLAMAMAFIVVLQFCQN